MADAQAAQVQPIAAEAAPEAKVTQLISENLPDFPGKEGVMITVEYPPGGSDPAAQRLTTARREAARTEVMGAVRPMRPIARAR